MASEQELRELICEVGRNLWRRGMVAANDGNISARLDNEAVLCTPTGVSKGYLRPEMLAIMHLDGSVLQEPSDGRQPSTEIKMHLAQYRANEDIGGCIHAHPMYATVMAIRERPLTEQLMPETTIAMPAVPLAPYATPSTPELGEATAVFAKSHTACLLAHHGAFTWGPDAWTAYLNMERLEYTAQITYLLERCNGLAEIPADEVQKLIGMRAQYGR